MTGERGARGDHGQHGDTGSVGPAGPAGAVGETGAHGVEGDPGERGKTGDIGQAGQVGLPGERGPANVRAYVAMGIAVAVALGVLGCQVSQNRERSKKIAGLVQRIDREGRDRRDQSCRGLELGHKQEIVDLTRTYAFYADPPPEFRGLLKSPLVRAQLRESERDARNDQDRFGVFVPAYCDEPGVGLSEPDPVVPRRPAALGG